MSLHRRRGFAALCAALALACGADAPTGPPPPIAEDDVPAVVAEFVAAVNTHRVGRGCGPLAWHASVAGVAQAHSADMVARGFFDHENPDGRDPFERLDAAGVAWTLAGENIAAGYATAPAVLQGWLASPGHRANIENCLYTHHGVGLAGTVWTHVFAAGVQ